MSKTIYDKELKKLKQRIRKINLKINHINTTSSKLKDTGNNTSESIENIL